MKERAEAMPLVGAAVFVLWKDIRGAVDGSRASAKMVFVNSFESTAGAARMPLCKVEREMGGVDFGQRTVALEA